MILNNIHVSILSNLIAIKLDRAYRTDVARVEHTKFVLKILINKSERSR